MNHEIPAVLIEEVCASSVVRIEEIIPESDDMRADDVCAIALKGTMLANTIIPATIFFNMKITP